MRKPLIPALLCSVALATPALADVPSVAADIPPVHALVARVMEGVGTPELIVQPGASPHGYALRPSEARALQDADAVFWIGPALTPWLEGPLDALSGSAQSVALMESPGSVELEVRTGATFEAHAHDHGEDDHDDDHDDHEDHDDHAGDDHGEHDDDHAGHLHDPHAWLDPENARTWLATIAETLSTVDPDNADAYRANAEAGRAELAQLIAETETRLAPLRDRPFVVFHDAYQYFETRFDIPAAGAISVSDAADPGPQRIAEIRDTVQALDVRCAFTEPQFNPGLVQTVFRGMDAKTGVIDPLGTALDPGAALYPGLIRSVADSLVACLE